MSGGFFVGFWWVSYLYALAFVALITWWWFADRIWVRSEAIRPEEIPPEPPSVTAGSLLIWGIFFFVLVALVIFT